MALLTQVCVVALCVLAANCVYHHNPVMMMHGMHSPHIMHGHHMHMFPGMGMYHGMGYMPGMMGFKEEEIQSEEKIPEGTRVLPQEVREKNILRNNEELQLKDLDREMMQLKRLEALPESLPPTTVPTIDI